MQKSTNRTQILCMLSLLAVCTTVATPAREGGMLWCRHVGGKAGGCRRVAAAARRDAEPGPAPQRRLPCWRGASTLVDHARILIDQARTLVDQGFHQAGTAARAASLRQPLAQPPAQPHAIAALSPHFAIRRTQFATARGAQLLTARIKHFEAQHGGKDASDRCVEEA